MGAASLAVFYVAFAIVLVYLNLSTIAKTATYEMNQAVSDRLETLPFSPPGRPPSNLRDNDITSPQDLLSWLNNVVANVIYEEQQAILAGSGDIDLNATSGQATVSSFNRVLLMRMTAKRRLLRDNRFGKFKAGASKNSYPKLLKGPSQLSPSAVNCDEDRATLCMPGGVAPCFIWQEEESYEEAGGYTVFIDPSEGPQAFRDRVQQWQDVGMFDLRMATFVLDFMAFNSNTDLFMHRGWTFSFDFAGNAQWYGIVRAFNLNAYSGEGKYLDQFVLRLVLWILVAIFVVREIVKLYNLGFYQHFRHKGAWIDMFSLLMCVISLLTYRIIESSSIFDSFTFTKLFDPSTRAATYQEMAGLGSQVEEQNFIIGLNLLLVFMRAVSLVADLQSNFRLILEVMDQCSSTLTYFLIMFILIMMGFVLMGFFVFGSGTIMFSKPVLAFYTTFSMLTGKAGVFHELKETDEVMSFIFFYSFYILFYLVFINVFVSILMSGYDMVVAKMKDTEESLLTKIADEIKHEFVDRIVAFGNFAGGFIYRCPLVDACASCFWGCVPSCSMPNVGKWFGRGSGDDEEKSSKAYKGPQSRGVREKTSMWEIFMVIAFMVNTLSFLTLQVRGQACFDVFISTVHQPLSQSKWMAQNPQRVESFQDIQQFQQVREWTKSVIGGVLYATPQCATLLPDGSATYTSPNSFQGCNNSKDNEQLVQIVNNWNIGFMNTTFVRLTIVPACFIANPDRRWRESAPWFRETPDVTCASADCISVLQEDARCKSPDGTSLSSGSITRIPVDGSTTDFYNWTNPGRELGSHAMAGGFVVSLGSSQSDAEAMLAKLEADDWFTQKTASMVFDFITYNGNLDLFTYHEVDFSLRASGRMDKSLKYNTFPMNINEGGGFYSTDRIWILALFSIYIFMVLCQCLEIVLRIVRIKRGKTLKRAAQDFFGDLWNVSDSISLCMAILAVIYFMMFALMPFRKDYKFSVDSRMRYQIPNDDEDLMALRKVDPGRYMQEDWYIFHQFQRAQSIYETFLTVSAINCFLFAIKVVKYVGQLKSVQVFSDTLDSGKTRNSYFATVILLQMIGFALFFHILFGESVEALSTWGSSILTLFEWMTGEYDLTALLKKDEVITVIWFVMFMFTFYFIATNMFLATMLSVYCDTVGNEDQERAQQKYRLRKDVVVHYHDKTAMTEEIKPENLELKEGEVIVRDLRPDTKPAHAGVMKGHILSKVNGEKLWKEHCKSVVDIFDRGIPEEGEINLEFMERASRQDRSWRRAFSLFKRGVVDDEVEVSVKPTCKNFWRMEGAIACIAREAAKIENEGEDDEGGGEGGRAQQGGGGGEDDEDGEGGDESGSDEEGGGGGRRTSEAAKKARRRLRTKKKLDSLLFSRWSDGKRQHGVDGAVGTGHGWESFGGSDEVGGQPKEIQYEVDHLEVFQLREEMMKLPIVGQEAWLDCLVSAIEREMDEDSVITDVLRTSEMQDVMKNKHGREQKPLQEFYRHADEVVKMLEFKANKKYYQYLQIESEQRQEQLRNQNEVLHDYVCELETEFSEVMQLIHANRAKKEVMLTKLAGLLDRTMYRHLDKTAPGAGRPALTRGQDEDEDERRRQLTDGATSALRNG